MPDVEFIPLGSLGDGDGATTLDYARSRARWQALPDGWLSAKDMRAELMRIARVPEYDGAAGEALLVAMEDFLEWRGTGAAREFRRVEVPPEPMSPVQILKAEAARRAEVERERFEREQQAREAQSAARDAVFLDGQRRVHRELSDEYVVPMIRALEARLAELERQLAQHGELEAGAGTTPTATATPSEAPAESRRARARRFMFGDMEQAEIERLLEEGEDEASSETA
jgi:hypothetical protein